MMDKNQVLAELVTICCHGRLCIIGCPFEVQECSEVTPQYWLGYAARVVAEMAGPNLPPAEHF